MRFIILALAATLMVACGAPDGSNVVGNRPDAAVTPPVDSATPADTSSTPDAGTNPPVDVPSSDTPPVGNDAGTPGMNPCESATCARQAVTFSDGTTMSGGVRCTITPTGLVFSLTTLNLPGEALCNNSTQNICTGMTSVTRVNPDTGRDETITGLFRSQRSMQDNVCSRDATFTVTAMTGDHEMLASGTMRSLD